SRLSDEWHSLLEMRRNSLAQQQLRPVTQLRSALFPPLGRPPAFHHFLIERSTKFLFARRGSPAAASTEGLSPSTSLPPLTSVLSPLSSATLGRNRAARGREGPRGAARGREGP